VLLINQPTWTTATAAAEIEYGIRRLDNSSRKYELLTAEKERLLLCIKVLPWDEKASVNFGIIKAQLEKSGTPIDDFDIAIAADAMSHLLQCKFVNVYPVVK
jgi:predicted nucleic acid-binding protein